MWNISSRVKSFVPTSTLPGEKGLRRGVLGFVSHVVVGVGSTAPAYSLAAVLGLVTLKVGLQSAAILIISFVPMLLIASAYHWLNKVHPDCGTTFAWVSRAMGPWVGWLGGWTLVAAIVVVIANLAQLAGTYSLLVVGLDGAAANKWIVLGVGVVWVLATAAIAIVGVAVSAKAQWILLSAEVVILFAFAIAAVVRGHIDEPAGFVSPSLDWFNPFAVRSMGALSHGVLVAVFIYWGWDSAVTLNEESKDMHRTPGRAAVASTVALVALYVTVAIAAQAYHGPAYVTAHAGDVLGALGGEVLGPLGTLLDIAVLTSTSAALQAAALSATRTSLSMAVHGAFPRALGRISVRFGTPSSSAVWLVALSIGWYVLLTALSQNLLNDAILGLGLLVAFYYGLTGYACTIFYRRLVFASFRNVALLGIAPVAGGLVLTWAFADSARLYADPAQSASGSSWLGVGPPLVIGVGLLALGVALMLVHRRHAPAFFARRRDAMDGPVAAGAAGSAAR